MYHILLIDKRIKINLHFEVCEPKMAYIERKLEGHSSFDKYKFYVCHLSRKLFLVEAIVMNSRILSSPF